MTYGNAKALRRNPLGAALVAALLIPGAAFAQDATTSSTPEGETTNLGKVQVIGSRIKRSEIEGPSPVTVITAEQIKQEGFNTVAEAIDTLSQNTGSVQNDFNAA